MVDSSTQRLRLGQAVVETTDLLYAAKRELEAARKNKRSNVEELSAVLKAARVKARDAQRAFDRHIVEHAGCRV